MKDRYESPLSGRYASRAMQALFSPDRRYGLWRALWAALARAEHELGLPVTAEQAEELAAHAKDPIDYAAVAAREKEVRHDVMAHIHVFGQSCPKAAGIIHLGATSCYVTDNADLIIYRDALGLVEGEIKAVLSALAAFAERYKSLATPGYTHFQPAQPVTVGKRACLWMQDLLLDLDELSGVLGSLRFLGCRGTTGTEASFLELFNGDGGKIDEMNRRLAAAFGFSGCYPVCGQTYPRKADSRILALLSAIAQSAYRFAGDIRLLQHERQVEEPFAQSQVGSSAMAYKRNPMRAERICALARYVMADALNGPMTAASQWLERTLDDSANRRISLPEAFLAVDGILRLYYNIASGLVVNEAVIGRAMAEYLPFAATENLLMEAVKRGGDRQALHEVIRAHSMAAAQAVKEGLPCDLLARLEADPAFPLSARDMAALLDPKAFVGRAPEQVDAFLAGVRPRLAGAARMEDVEL